MLETKSRQPAVEETPSLAVEPVRRTRKPQLGELAQEPVDRDSHDLRPRRAVRCGETVEFSPRRHVEVHVHHRVEKWPRRPILLPQTHHRTQTLLVGQEPANRDLDHRATPPLPERLRNPRNTRSASTDRYTPTGGPLGVRPIPDTDAGSHLSDRLDGAAAHRNPFGARPFVALSRHTSRPRQADPGARGVNPRSEVDPHPEPLDRARLVRGAGGR